MASQSYPDRRRELLQGLGHLHQVVPETMSAFDSLHSAATADGALPASTKQLMALAVGIAVHCDGCIAFHVHDALAAGATVEEIEETVGVAVMMGGGPAVVYGADALTALREFTAADRTSP